MKIIISPAKTLNFESKLPTSRGTQPQFLETTAKINRKLSKMSKKGLSELMNISKNLTELNHQRYLDFSEEHNKKNSRPAMYAFAGDVYMGLDAYSISTKKLDAYQDQLRILSGFYGILRPLDLIQPHRCEMGTSLKVGRKNNLYEVWKDKITPSLKEELKDGELFVNLASNEYFKAIDTKKLKTPVIHPVFKDYKNGELKVIAFFAKQARGAMARYLIDSGAKTPDDIKGFNAAGYRFSEEETKKKGELVFIR